MKDDDTSDTAVPKIPNTTIIVITQFTSSLSHHNQGKTKIETNAYNLPDIQTQNNSGVESCLLSPRAMDSRETFQSIHLTGQQEIQSL